MLKFKNQIISISKTVKDAIKQLESKNINLLIVEDENKKVCGTFTMGDFRRGILNNIDINNNLSKVINKNFYYLLTGFEKREAKNIFTSDKFVSEIPILDKKLKLSFILKRKDILSKKQLQQSSLQIKNTPLILMAGGKGTRLDPFTKILPKPLIPFGNEAIIINIMESFKEFGLNKFYISVHHKANIIKGFFYEHENNYNIEFVEEKKPLGTAGVLK